jgi:hypothetical protein
VYPALMNTNLNLSICLSCCLSPRACFSLSVLNQIRFTFPLSLREIPSLVLILLVLMLVLSLLLLLHARGHSHATSDVHTHVYRDVHTSDVLCHNTPEAGAPHMRSKDQVMKYQQTRGDVLLCGTVFRSKALTRPCW